MGSFRAAGQLQQRPAALEGEVLKRAWWRFYNPDLLAEDQIKQLPRFSRIVTSWDTAFKDKTTSDYVVGQVWGIDRADRYLLYSYRQRANLQATKDAMRAAYLWVERRWRRARHTILIEKSANGVEIIAELKRELPGVQAVSVSTDKITRAIAASAPLESGNVFLPGRLVPGSAAGYQAADWVTNLIEEAAIFPNGKNDDQVDAFSQAINWAREHSGGPATIHVPRGQLPEIDYGYEQLYGQPRTRQRCYPSHTTGLARRPVHTLESLAAYLGLPITNGYPFGNRE